jgi:hypothetical protein
VCHENGDFFLHNLVLATDGNVLLEYENSDPFYSVQTREGARIQRERATEVI